MTPEEHKHELQRRVDLYIQAIIDNPKRREVYAYVIVDLLIAKAKL